MPDVLKRYSGKGSEAIWARVQAIKHPCLRSAVYVFGCALQEIENRFWQALTDAEMPAPKKEARSR